MPHPTPFKRGRAAFALVETMTSVGVIALFIAAMIVMTSNVLGLLRSSRDTITASQSLQKRTEEIRMANWLQITNPAFLTTHVFTPPEESSLGLAGYTETITISPYPADPTVANAKIIRKNGAWEVAATNPSLKNQRMVQVDVSVNWTGVPNSKYHTRTSTSLVARTTSNN